MEFGNIVTLYLAGMLLQAPRGIAAWHLLNLSSNECRGP